MPIKTDILQEMNSRFYEIIDSKADRTFKDIRLGSLASDLERVFEIPRVAGKKQEAFGEKNPQVMELYRKVLEAKSI